MKELYIPEREVCIDKSMVLWRGQLVFHQYIKNKRHNYGVKLYELCESSGIVQKILIYSGQVMLSLMDEFLDKGYILYTDNYYNSVPLTKAMSQRSTYIYVWNSWFTRKDNPKDLVKKKVEERRIRMDKIRRSSCVQMGRQLVICTKWKW